MTHPEPSPDKEPSLADLLRDAIHESGLSVRHLAISAGVDQSNLNKFLSGERDNLTLEVADRLFRVLGLRLVSTKKTPKRRTTTAEPS